MAESGGLDDIFARIDDGGLELTEDNSFIPGLIKAALERGLQAELTDQLGYEKGAVEAELFSNSRNGTSPKTLSPQVGDVALDVLRDRDGTFIPRLVPKGSRRLGGLDGDDHQALRAG
ncbi:transposase [Arthrobacter sp. NPDC093128]|uniref:transposase n=1 Tax=Arthrobacter sp. NPDC093128 TaxID=3154979 RepID=UPI00343AADA8